MKEDDVENKVPQTDEQVKARIFCIYADRTLANTLWDLYRVIREEGAGVEDAWKETLLTHLRLSAG